MTKQPHRPGGSPAGTGGQFDTVERPRVEADLHVEHDRHSTPDQADRAIHDCMDRVRQHLEDFDDPHKTERELGALINDRLDGQGDDVSAAAYEQCYELIEAAKARDQADRAIHDCMDRVRQHLEDFDDPYETERELGALINGRLDGQGDDVSAVAYEQCYELIEAAKARRDEMESVVAARGVWAHGGDLAGTASEWRAAGFEAEQAARWLDSGTFDPDSAASLQNVGITPDQAGTDLGEDIPTTLGYAVSNGGLSVQDAWRYLHD